MFSIVSSWKAYHGGKQSILKSKWDNIQYCPTMAVNVKPFTVHYCSCSNWAKLYP